jgi:hypothetical protein
MEWGSNEHMAYIARTSREKRDRQVAINIRMRAAEEREAEQLKFIKEKIKGGAQVLFTSEQIEEARGKMDAEIARRNQRAQTPPKK